MKVIYQESCGRRWEEEGVLHTCFLVKGHDGACRCGWCDLTPTQLNANGFDVDEDQMRIDHAAQNGD